MHLLRANPVPEVVSFADHSMDIASKLQGMVEQHREEICEQPRAARAALERGAALSRGYARTVRTGASTTKEYSHGKTIKLIKEEQAKADGQATREAIFARVDRTIERCAHMRQTKAWRTPRPSCWWRRPAAASRR